MDKTLVVLCFSFVVALFVIKCLKPVAFWLQIVDKPGGRKKHDGLIPLVGGVSIYFSVLLSVLLFLEQPVFLRLFMLSGGLIVFIGLLDDRYNLSARTRLVGQMLVCSIFVYGLDVQILSFGNLFGFGELELGVLAYPLTILSLMGAMNAFNMLDGMDGLVGSIAIISFLGLIFLFAANGNLNLMFLCVSFIGALLAFLLFNIWGDSRNKFLKKVFMGDAGSMFLGLSIGVLLVKGSQGESAAFAPIVSLWLILLPMTDMFTIMYRRFKRGQSPMLPDRTHIHHILLRAGFAKYQTLCIILFAQLIFVFSALISVRQGLSEVVSLALIVAVVAIYQVVMKKSWRLIRYCKRYL